MKRLCLLFLGILVGCSGGESELETGRELLSKGQFQPAIEVLSSGLEKATTLRPDILNARGVAYFQLNDYTNALLDYEQAITEDSTRYQPFFNKAKLRVAQGSMDDGLRDYTKAALLAPDSAEIFLNRGFLYAQKKEVLLAASDFDTALRLAPNNAEAHFVRGNLYLENQQYPEAIQRYEKALSLKPRFGKCYYNLGLAQYFVNNREAACLALRQAQKEGYPQATEALGKWCK